MKRVLWAFVGWVVWASSALGIILLSPNLAMAGQYKMIRDTIDVPHSDGIYTQEKHAEVCTAFLKNLEASPPYPPMACDVTFKPEFADFKTPEWLDMDVWENRDLELQILQHPPEGQEERERWMNYLKSSTKSGMTMYRTAKFDIDNDGVPEQVLSRIHDGMCDAKKYADEMAWRHYKVYDPVSRKIDLQKSKFYDGYWGTTSLFSYKGVTYYASFGGSTEEPYFGKNDHARKWYIRLYRPIPMNQGIKQPVALGCEYLYLPIKKQGGN